MAYMLCFAMIIFALLLEWMGFMLYSRADKDGLFMKLFPQIGDIGFVLFITTAFVFPASSFTVIIFAIGVTKIMRPEVLLAIWVVADLDYQEEEQGIALPRSVTMVVANRTSSMARSATTRDGKSSTGRISMGDALMGRSMPRRTAAADRSRGAGERGPRMERRTSTTEKAVELMKNAGESVIGFASDSAKRVVVTISEEKLATAEKVALLSQCVGLLLHHSTMSFIFATGSLHLFYTDRSLEVFGVWSMLFFVLSQHFVSQVVPQPTMLRNALLLLIEIFFQWFVLSSLSHVGSTMLCVGLLCLAISHWLFVLSIVVKLGCHLAAAYASGGVDQMVANLRQPSPPTTFSSAPLQSIATASASGDAACGGHTAGGGAAAEGVGISDEVRTNTCVASSQRWSQASVELSSVSVTPVPIPPDLADLSVTVL